MIIITSAAYVSPALISEFGKLPPVMLPVQNKRLYEHQLDLIKKNDFGEIFITLPQKYEVEEYDAIKLNDVGIVRIPENFTLGQSIVYALNVIGNYEDALYILHGDTLFSRLDTTLDVYSISFAEDNYAWSVVDGESDERVFSGFFSFSSVSGLIQMITESNYDFIKGVKAYIKGKFMNPVSLDNWMDFGLVNTYYRSISKLTTQRIFNDLKISKYSVVKYSRDSRKILAEANWFASLPPKMRYYAPALWDKGVTDDGRGYYEIEYYYLSSLATLFVFGKIPVFVWKEIMKSCVDFIECEAQYKPVNIADVTRQNNLYFADKTNERLSVFCEKAGIDMNTPWVINDILVPSLAEIVEETDRSIRKDCSEFTTLMHGDFCFSNILYDFKSKSIRVIDPRGIDNSGVVSIYGDLRYDVAKLSHSVLGMYDFIIAGHFYYSERNKYNVTIDFKKSRMLDDLQCDFKKNKINGYTLKELSVYPMLVHLFLSMLPLHSDNVRRQKAMLANALRLYVEFKKNS